MPWSMLQVQVNSFLFLHFVHVTGNWECRNGGFILESTSKSFFTACNAPTRAPTLSPTTSAPTRSPTDPTLDPTAAPTLPFERQITLSLQYDVNGDESECDIASFNFSGMATSYTDGYKDVDALDVRFTVTVTEDASDSMLWFVYSAFSASESVLDEFEAVLLSTKFQKKLKRNLMKTEDGGDLEGDLEGDGDDDVDDDTEGEGEGDGVCFELLTMEEVEAQGDDAVNTNNAFFGTTEYLILILVLLVFCIALVVGLYLKYKWMQRQNKESWWFGLSASMNPGGTASMNGAAAAAVPSSIKPNKSTLKPDELFAAAAPASNAPTVPGSTLVPPPVPGAPPGRRKDTDEGIDL